MLKTSFQFRCAAAQQFLSAFPALGYIGVAAASLLGMVLVRHAQLSNWMIAEIVVVAVVTFFLLVFATKIITGEERIIYYHHEIGVMLATALLLRVLRQPMLPYLDITIVGIGTFLVCGRIGCLMVGCCHGRPWRWGVRYGEEHAAAGFPSYLVGVRLFPIQAVESLWVLCTVVVGTFFVWSGRPHGTALAWYVIIYDVGRFVFEFARGDADRPYWLGFSQPQWLSVLLTGGVVWAEKSGVLPLVRWHFAAFVLLIVTMLAVSLRRHFQKISSFQLLHPRHVKQIASAIHSLQCSRENAAMLPEPGCMVVSVSLTSLGIQISGSELRSGNERVCQYTLSSQGKAMSRGTAELMVRLIRQFTGATGPEKLVAGNSGVFHVLMVVPLEANS